MMAAGVLIWIALQNLRDRCEGFLCQVQTNCTSYSQRGLLKSILVWAKMIPRRTITMGSPFGTAHRGDAEVGRF